MAKLISVDEVLTRMGIPDNASARTKIAVALDAVTTRLELLLRTEFAYGEQTDYYAVDCSVRPLIQNGLVLFGKYGFIDPVEPVAYKWADTITDLKAAIDTAVDLQLIANERGLHYMEAFVVPQQRFYISVTYKKGFTLPASPGGDAPNDVYLGVPNWVRELAFLDVQTVLTNGPCEPTDEEKDSVKEFWVGPWTRWYGGAYTPIF